MVFDCALLLPLLFVLLLSTTFVHANRKQEKKEECLFILKGISQDESCLTLQRMLDKHEVDQMISTLEEWLQVLRTEGQKLPFHIELIDPLTDFNRIFASNVIAKYTFEENVLDSSGKSHHGTAIGGITYESQGVSGLAASFQGKQRVIVDSLRNFDWGSRFSVSIWFKRTGEWSNYQGMVSNGYHSIGSWELRMGREMSGQMLGGGVNTADSPKTWNYINIQAAQNVWHHVAMTYDGETLNYYLDNVRQGGDQNCCHGDILIKDTPVTIGQGGVGKSNEYFYGLLDELTIFNKVLSTDEISTIYRIQNPGECSDPSLIAYFPFDKSFNDESCYERKGKAAGGVTITGSDSISGSSAYFRGNGLVNVDLLSAYEWGNQFTVSVWFKRTGGWGNYQGIVSNGYYNKGSWEIRMGRENSGQMLGGGVVTSGSSKTWDYVHLLASQSKWHHVTMTYDGSQLFFYLDGVKQKGNDLCCSGDIVPRKNPLTIGKAGVGKTEYFYGYVDELKIYSRALSESEVSDIYEKLAK